MSHTLDQGGSDVLGVLGRTSAPAGTASTTVPRAGTNAFVKTRAAMIAADTMMISIAALAALVLRSQTQWLASIGVTEQLGDFPREVAPQLSLLWLLALWAFGAQSPRRTGVGSWEYQRVLTASLGTAAFVGIGAYMVQTELSRGFFVIFFGIGTTLLLVGRLALRRAIQRAHVRGHFRSRVLVAGTDRHIDDVARVLRRESWLGYEVVGGLSPTPPPSGETLGGVEVVGDPSAVSAVLERTDVDAIVFADGALPCADDFRRTAWDLESRNVQMIVVPSLSDISRQRLDVRPVAGLPFVHVERPQRDLPMRVCKRIFDVVGSGLLLLLLSPVTLLVALAIVLDDRGPVLFRQRRVGIAGQHFACFKFRSMCQDADAVLQRLTESDEGSGVLFKMKADPRITRVGRVLRRYSLDELPQLLNVFAGHMSLVGPRPPLPREVDAYEGDIVQRLRVRPGMTGLWQVSGRSDLSWEDTVRLDLYYADNWSITQDAMILLRTVKAVVGGRGAY